MPAQKRTPSRRSPQRAARPNLPLRLFGFGLKGAGAVAGATKRTVARRPATSLGLSAFAILFAGVSANALYGQAGHRHGNPMLATRLGAATDGRAVGSTNGGAAVPLVSEVQEALAGAGYYRQSIDGRPGPATETAIRAFQKAHDLKPEGAATPLVLSQIRQIAGISATGAPNPSPRPNELASLSERMGAISDAANRPVPDQSTDGPDDAIDDAIAGLSDAELVKRIQAGLSSAQVAELSADGIAGARTREAIRTFQALEGLDVTGKPEPQILERLIAIGAVQ